MSGDGELGRIEENLEENRSSMSEEEVEVVEDVLDALKEGRHPGYGFTVVVDALDACFDADVTASYVEALFN